MRLDWRPRGGRESPANGDLGRLRHEIAHPNQVVSGRREGEHPSDFVRPPEPRLALQGNCLHPAEDFLDTFSFSLADGVARLTRGPRINGATPVGVVLRHMRRDTELFHLLHEVRCIIAAIRT